MENINSENPIELSLKQKIDFVQSYQRTFNNWKSNYTKRVNDFVNDFVDNSEIIFIENEIDNIDNILLELDQALKDNYFEKDSIDLLDINPMRDLYIDVRIESAIKSKSTYKKIKSFLEQRKKEIEFEAKPQTKAVPDNEQNNKSAEVKNFHNNIFVGNSVEVWERYKENKQLTASDRTDLRLIFELMKIDKLIKENIELKHYKSWLNKFHFENSIDELKKVELNTKPNIQRANDYNEYKKATLK